MIIIQVIIRSIVLFFALWKIKDLLAPIADIKNADKKQIFKFLLVLVGVSMILIVPIQSVLTEAERESIDLKFLINTIYGQQIIKGE